MNISAAFDRNGVVPGLNNTASGTDGRTNVSAPSYGSCKTMTINLLDLSSRDCIYMSIRRTADM